MRKKDLIKLNIVPKCFKGLNKLFYHVGKRLENGFIEIIKIKLHESCSDKSCFYVYLLGKRLLNVRGGGICLESERPVVYLTVNKLSDYTILCIQQWIDVIYYMKSDFYFICDNKQLEYRILKEVVFYGTDIKFMPSMKRRLKSICKTVATEKWKNAACAHLTSFYHAKDRGILRFWKIDADDTFICCKPQKIAEALHKVRCSADEKNVEIISLDMWRSRTQGRHWTWGVAYVNTENTDFCKICSENTDLSWANSGQYPYRVYKQETNIDWFFTYLKIHKKIAIETFYIENAIFVHWGNFLQAPRMVAAIYYWSQKKLLFPVYYYIHKNHKSGMVLIAEDCFKIDIGLTEEESLEWLNTKMQTI